MEESLTNIRASKGKKMCISGFWNMIFQYFFLKHMNESIRQAYVIDKVLFDSDKSYLPHFPDENLEIQKTGIVQSYIQNIVSQTLIEEHGISNSGISLLDSIASQGIQTAKILRGNQVGKLHELLNDDVKGKMYIYRRVIYV